MNIQIHYISGHDGIMQQGCHGLSDTRYMSNEHQVRTSYNSISYVAVLVYPGTW